MVFLINILIDYLIYYSKDTKEFYDKRSNIVHGGSPINENSKLILKILKLFYNILEIVFYVA